MMNREVMLRLFRASIVAASSVTAACSLLSMRFFYSSFVKLGNRQDRVPIAQLKMVARPVGIRK
jgi:hypothetical protein